MRKNQKRKKKKVDTGSNGKIKKTIYFTKKVSSLINSTLKNQRALINTLSLLEFYNVYSHIIKYE